MDANTLTLAGGTLRFHVLGFPGQSVTVFATSDFVEWMPLQTHPCTGTRWEFADAAAGQFAKRIYRAVLTL